MQGLGSVHSDWREVQRVRTLECIFESWPSTNISIKRVGREKDARSPRYTDTRRVAVIEAMHNAVEKVWSQMQIYIERLADPNSNFADSKNPGSGGLPDPIRYSNAIVQKQISKESAIDERD